MKYFTEDSALFRWLHRRRMKKLRYELTSPKRILPPYKGFDIYKHAGVFTAIEVFADPEDSIKKIEAPSLEHLILRIDKEYKAASLHG